MTAVRPTADDRRTGVETYRDSYLAFVRGAHAGEPGVAEVYGSTREELVEVALAAVPLLDGAWQRQLVRAWFAFTEGLVLQWTQDPVMPRDELLQGRRRRADPAHRRRRGTRPGAAGTRPALVPSPRTGLACARGADPAHLVAAVDLAAVT